MLPRSSPIIKRPTPIELGNVGRARILGGCGSLSCYLSWCWSVDTDVGVSTMMFATAHPVTTGTRLHLAVSDRTQLHQQLASVAGVDLFSAHALLHSTVGGVKTMTTGGRSTKNSHDVLPGRSMY